MATMYVQHVALTDMIEGNKEGRTWQKATVIVQTLDSRGDRIAFEVYGTDRILKFQKINTGDVYVIHYRLESNQYEGRWYTHAIVYDCESTNTIRG